LQAKKKKKEANTMKKAVYLQILTLIFCINLFAAGKNQPADDFMKNIHWLHHSSFMMILGDKTVYIDPYEIGDVLKPADIIFITHEHFDHFSPADIKKIIKKGTLVVCPVQVFDKLKNSGYMLKLVRPGESFTDGKILVSAVPAYNIVKPFHPKKDLKVGYVISYNGIKIYHAGDTDFIPEMSLLKNIDIAMVPVSGLYTMGPEEAARAVNAIRPEIAIPMHYGYKIGPKENGEKFKALVNPAIKVVILKSEVNQDKN
jgi:L-ascorbate metabolism protein UlaG (beta-lactamase superfamily)